MNNRNDKVTPQEEPTQAEIDPAKRSAARTAILSHADARDCTVYRPDEQDPEADHEEMGDAKLLFVGQFQAPQDWDAKDREEFFGDLDPELFIEAFIECEAAPASKGFFAAEVGDYVAAMPGGGHVVMYQVFDYYEDENGRKCVLVQDPDPML
ncbi:hypothetical protein D3880_06520 [Pseudomonas cavernae]|uniref:Uncharacterized protein n=1 Tax=Pseudomonas cavernae TaxID=2320867 RepID=A0A385YZ66_9PSED|nr:hypothetical protein [Pseudomonas cavernae]AYC32056.1 hypothetical protein D3880_06520 [Pseudomonas cavernae]